MHTTKARTMKVVLYCPKAKNQCLKLCMRQSAILGQSKRLFVQF